VNAFEKWSLWITSALTGLTGVAYFWTKYLVEAQDPFAVVNHPLQPFFLKAHILVSPLLLVALGMILVRHVWKHYRLGVVWARKSGLTTFGVLVPMVVTGYLIQAVTGQGWLQAVVVAHLVTGFGYLAFLGLHQIAVSYLRPTADCRRSDEECERSVEECRESPERCGTAGSAAGSAGEARRLVSIQPRRPGPRPRPPATRPEEEGDGSGRRPRSGASSG